MENWSEELFRFLNDSGKIGMLRKYTISFLITVQELTAEFYTLEDRDCEEAGRLIKNIEFHLHQLTLHQQNADRMFLEMRKEDRQAFYREAPGILELFGWHDKVNEDGDIVRT